MVIRVVAVGFMLLAWACANAQHAGHEDAVRVELAASAAFDAQGVLWVVSKSGGHVMLRRSADAGKSWSAAQAVNAVPEGIGAEGDARPKIALGTRSEVYVTWTQPLSKPYSGDIRFARSIDAGKTFSVPLTVHTDRQEITHRFDALTVTRDGKLFIAWIDKRDMMAAGKGANYQGAAVYFAVSDNRGASFGGDHKLADHSCECCRIAMLPRDDGSVLALWRHVFEPNVRDHALGVMHADGRVSAVRRATFDDWAVDICPHHGPSLAADAAGMLHAVWFTQGAKRAGVFYGRLRLSGDGGVDALRRVGGEAAAHADLAVSGKRVVVVWKEYDGTRSRLRAMMSDNGGDTWRERDLLATAGASDQPRALTHAGRIYAFWNTQREGFTTTVIAP
ncbi:MAG TPA: sialidase family protein [Burkholderiales bacterium]|nr:sialidase family protein [Burkholderiales bacterium]